MFRSSFPYIALVAYHYLSPVAASIANPHRRHIFRDNSKTYSLISPSVLADVESRHDVASLSLGNHVANGLSAVQDLVTAEYGLRDSESFYWGIDGNPLANVTAYAYGEDVRVLSLERFDSVLQAAQCSADSIKLTFSQEVQFQDVKQAWSWVNNADDNYIVLVTESSRCNIADGDDTIRQPWHIKQASFDESANTVTLAAEPKTWDDAFSAWHLRVDSRGFVPSSTKPQPRSPTVERDIIVSPVIHLAHNFSGHSIDLSDTDGNDGGSITCIDCSTSGELDIVIDIDVTVIPLSLTGYLEVIAKDVGTHIEVGLDVKKGHTLGGSGTLFQIDLPFGFIGIPGIATLSPQLTIALDGSIEPVDKDLKMTTGIEASITDNSTAAYDLGTHSTNKSGWKPTFEIIDTMFSNDVNITGKIGPSISLAYHGQVGPSILDIAGGDIGLELIAPEFTIHAEVFEKSEAAAYSCPTPPDDFGISMEVNIGLDLDVFEDIYALGFEEAATQTIFAVSTSIFSTCIGETGAPNATNGLKGHGNSTGTALPTGTPLPSAPYGSGPCPINGQLVCNGPDFFAICNWGAAVWQPVSNGTACENNQIVGTGIYANPPVYPTGIPGYAGPCPVNGQLVCNGSNLWGLCNWGRAIWQPVAGGTECRNGLIVGVESSLATTGKITSLPVMTGIPTLQTSVLPAPSSTITATPSGLRARRLYSP